MRTLLATACLLFLSLQEAFPQSPIAPNTQNWKLTAVSATDNLGDATVQNALVSATDYTGSTSIAANTVRTFTMKMPAMSNAGMFTYSIESDITGISVATYSSTDGSNWTTISSSNYHNGRGDDLQKADIPASVSNNWFRISFTNASTSSKNLKEIGMYQFLSGKNQYFLLFGASITESSGNHSDWKSTIATRLGAGYQPVIFNWSISGAVTAGILSNVDEYLANHPQAAYVFLETAGNDVTATRPLTLAKSKTSSMTQLDQDMRSIVQKIINAGKVPVFSRISYRNYPFTTSWMGFDQPSVNNGQNQENGSLPYNFMVDKIIKEMCPLFWDANERRGIIDFYQLTLNNPSWLIPDGVHFYGSDTYHIRDFWTDYAFKYIYTGQRSAVVPYPEPVANLTSIATSAVSTAETSGAEQDIWNARILVEQIANTSTRLSLTDRLDHIGSGTPTNQLPTVSLTSPANNASFTYPTAITLTASAADADGTVSKVDFYYGTTLLYSDVTAPYSFTWSGAAVGSYNLTAKATDNAGGETTSAAVNISVTSGTNKYPSVSLTSPTNNATFVSPATILLNATATDDDGTIAKVNFYNGTTLLYSDATYPYSYSWTGVTPGTYSLLAKAADNLGAVKVSTTIMVTVTSASNIPPTVSLTAPTNNTTFTAPATISLTATAADADGTVSKVDFYNGATLLFSDASSPYAFSWTNVAAGSYTLTAKATDNTGAAMTSTAVTVSVNPPANTPPTVSLTAPANNTSFTAPATISLTATAADADGTVSKVDFYNGATLLFSDVSSPYAYSWIGVAAGSYTLTAKATDDGGAVTTSGTVTIIVNTSGNMPPTVAFTSPANNASYISPASFALQATATDVDGSISKIDFYQGSTLVSSDSWAPYSTNVWNLNIGTYAFTAIATDNSGASSSTTIQVIVTDASIYFTSSAECFTPGATLTIQVIPAKQTNATNYAWSFTGQGATIAYTPGTAGYTASVKASTSITSGNLCCGISYADNSYRQYCKSMNKCASTREEDADPASESDANKKVQSMTIYGLTGEIEFTQGTFPVSEHVELPVSLPLGMHIIRVLYSDGTSEVKKILKTQ